jgi:hypothetical protein
MTLQLAEMPTKITLDKAEAEMVRRQPTFRCQRSPSHFVASSNRFVGVKNSFDIPGSI